MAIYTRMGSEVEIRYRCDDFADTQSVHIAFMEDLNGNLITTYVHELRADNGLGEILNAADSRPIAHCTGKHDDQRCTCHAAKGERHLRSCSLYAGVRTRA